MHIHNTQRHKQRWLPSLATRKIQSKAAHYEDHNHKAQDTAMSEIRTLYISGEAIPECKRLGKQAATKCYHNSQVT